MLEKILIVGNNPHSFLIASIFSNSGKEVFLLSEAGEKSISLFFEWQLKNQGRFFFDSNKDRVRETDFRQLQPGKENYWVIDTKVDENEFSKSYLDFLLSDQVGHLSCQSITRLDLLRAKLLDKVAMSGVAISLGEQLLVEFYQLSDTDFQKNIEELINPLGGSVFYQKDCKYFYAYLLGAIACISAFQAAKKYHISPKKLNSITGKGLKITNWGIFDLLHLYPHLTHLVYQSDDFRKEYQKITGTQIGEIIDFKEYLLHNQKITALKAIRKNDRLDLRLQQAINLRNQYGKFYKD